LACLPAIDQYKLFFMTIRKDEFELSTDREKMDLEFIHGFLSREAYWCRDIPFDTVKRSVDNSLNFGIFHSGHGQIGFARVITDYATIAYLGDVFILPEYRGRGLSKWMMEQVMTHPGLQGLRRWILLTADAHGLYRQFGWQPAARPELYMEMHDPIVYKKS
jgi:GNAT superfamily N-acetyltransferase